MRLGVLTVLYGNLSREAALDKITALGVQAVEFGTGNFPGDAHCKPDELLEDDEALRKLQRSVEERGLTVSALSQHGNPLHPDEGIARAAHGTWRKTVRLAERLGVDIVNAFSGCPGGDEEERRPNWVTCAWPEDFTTTLEWQWSERVIPYWTKEARFARDHGVRIAFEMHPGFVVYNPETLLRLRAEVGEEIGANFDPSHLFWQGIDAVEAIKVLGGAGAIFHFHAKDTYVDPTNARVNGVLDTKLYERVGERAWSFRTVGYGHSEKIWRDIVSALRIVGYDHVVSIEHEDALMSIDEGLAKAVALLDRIILKEAPTEMWWA